MGSVYPLDETFVRGGIEAVALYLAEGLARYPDVEVHVISCSPLVRRSHTERRGRITVHWLATGDRFYSIRAVTIDAWRVRRVYRRLGSDVIHAQGFSEYALARPTNVPMLLSVHGVEMLVPHMMATAHYCGLAGTYRRRIGPWIAHRSLNLASAIVSNAGGYIPQVLGTRLAGKRVYSVFNPIAEDFFNLPEMQQAIRGYLLWVGLISERKNLLHMLQAFAAVRERLPEARLRLVGPVQERAYMRRLEAEVARLHLGSAVEFLGRLDQSELLRCYQNAAVFVMTSLEETAPMALAQALASGKPVVATDVGGVRWMVDDGTSGFVVPSNDVGALAARLVALLSDPVCGRTMGKAAREGALRRFVPCLVAESTVAAYRELAARGDLLG